MGVLRMTRDWKKIGLGWLEFFVWGIVLCAATVVLIFVAEQFVEVQENLQVYYIGILAGGTGGIWGYGVTRAYDFCKELEKEGLKKSFGCHILGRIAIFIVASIIIILMGIMASLF